MSFSYSMFFVKKKFSFNKNTQIATLIWKSLDFAIKKRNLGLIKYDAEHEFLRGIRFGIMSHNIYDIIYFFQITICFYIIFETTLKWKVI